MVSPPVTETDNELMRRIELLERTVARLVDSRSIGSAIAGTFSLKFPQRIQGPNGDPYILVREVGGNLSLVAAANVSSSDWSDA